MLLGRDNAARSIRVPKARIAKLLQLIGVPLPHTTAWAVTLLEVFGGLAILLGVVVTIASTPLIASMLVAMVFAGAGPLSLDSWLARQRGGGGNL
jgi:uncharacterized membrane protein YphA (DoxX/SURF4 family)